MKWISKNSVELLQIEISRSNKKEELTFQWISNHRVQKTYLPYHPGLWAYLQAQTLKHQSSGTNWDRNRNQKKWEITKMMKIHLQTAQSQSHSLQIEDLGLSHFSILPRIMRSSPPHYCRISWSFRVRGLTWNLPPKTKNQIKLLTDYRGTITSKRAARLGKPCLSYRRYNKEWTPMPTEIGKSTSKHQCGAEINKVWRRRPLVELQCRVWTAWPM